MTDLEELANNEQIKELILKTKPTPATNLGLTKIEAYVSFGRYDFYFKNENQEENCINLHPYTSDLYIVLEFLWALTDIKQPICTFIEDEGRHGIFYAESFNDNQIRFVVADDYELYIKFCQTKEHYSFADAHICLDIIINKNRSIKQFYKKLWNEIKDWKSVKFLPHGNKIYKNSEDLIEKLNKYINIR